MAGDMRYIIRTAEGKEYGPAEQDTLEQWAKAGRITAECEVRNALMKKWHKAEKIPFLKPIIETQVPEEAPTVKAKWSKLVNPTGDIQKQKAQAVVSLTKGGVFKYTAADTGERFASFLFDVIILGIVGGVLFTTLTTVISGDGAYFAFTALYFIVVAMYFTISMGFTAQTVGQYFWGIMVVRPGGEPVLLGRAFVFTMFLLMFFPATLLFVYCLPSKRSLQDMLSGVLVAKIKVTN